MGDVLDVIRRQTNRDFAIGRIQSAQAVTDAQNLPDAVTVKKRHGDGTDDIVDSRAQAAAGHKGRPGSGGIEKNLPAGSGQFNG